MYAVGTKFRFTSSREGTVYTIVAVHEKSKSYWLENSLNGNTSTYTYKQLESSNIEILNIKWVNLYTYGPGSRYYDSEEEARMRGSLNAAAYVKTISVEL